MIKFKSLLKEIHDVESLTPKDVFNFYYLWHTALNSPESVQTPYGKEVLNYYLGQLKAKYVRLFTRLMAKQIVKYVRLKRTDADFPANQNLKGQSPENLLALMKKTFRSDMQRRNDLWELVGDFVVKLSKANSAKDMFLWINQLNNTVHNTKGKVLDKLPNFYTDLNRAFDVVDKAKNVEAFRQQVDKDIRDLKDQTGPGHPEDYGQGELHEGLEKIALSPDMLAQLSKPASEPSSYATQQDIPMKDKKPEKRDKETPAELELGPLEGADFDFYGNAGKRIDATTPIGKSPAPVFGPKSTKPKGKGQKDNNQNDKEEDKFKLGPLQEALQITKSDRENMEFMLGLKQGVQDKSSETKRDLNGYSGDFIRGYNSVKRPGVWDKFNQRLTQWASDFGRSYGRR